VTSTQDFPRIEKELFPEMKDCDMQLLYVRYSKSITTTDVYTIDICDTTRLG
jgi:hypothetical protein